MKKLIYGSLFLAVVGIGIMNLSSCKKEVENINPSNTRVETFKNNNKVVDKSTINAFIDKQQLSENNSDFVIDNSNLYYIGPENNLESVIFANQIGFDPNNDFNYGLSMVLDEDGEWGNLIYTRTKKISSDVFEISHYDENMTLLLSVELNSTNETINITYQYPYTDAAPGWGQRTMDCIADTYSNHGWISVWASIQTAFIPQTAAFIAGACAIKNI